MNKIITYDFSIDTLVSVDAEVGTNPDTLLVEVAQNETYSQQMQDELEPIEEPLDSKAKLYDELGAISSGYYESYPNNLPRLIKEMEDE